MKAFELIVVGLILSLAGIYLLWAFFPKKKGGCGCGTVDCKVPKPKLTQARKLRQP